VKWGIVCALVLLAVGTAGASTAGASVVLNEVNCEGTDWVEFVNTGDAAADVSGWLLTDDPLDSARADHRLIFGSGTTIAGQGVLVVSKGTAGFPFGVKCGEDTIRLADAGGALADEVVVPALATADDTWGRYPNGTGDWRETTASPGTPNAPSEASGGEPADAAGWLFEAGHVVEIDLGLSDEARAQLDAEPAEYVAGTFSLTTSGGTYGPYAVGVRLKGSTSFRPLSGKSAFKVSFNEVVPGQRFLGLRRLTLNNMVQDPSMLHELLAYELFHAAGVPAPRAGNAFVRVNGEVYGVYLDLETPDAVSLPRWFPTTRHLYEGSYRLDVQDGSLDEFEVDEGDGDRSDLEALTAAAGAGSFSDDMAGVADLDEMTRMWAVERYIGHWDGYSGVYGPNNYFLHSDATGRFSMLPWGTDHTWGMRTSFDSGGGRLFASCLREPSCRARYRAALDVVRSRAAGLDLDKRARDLAAALAPWQEIDPRREQSLGEISGSLAELHAFIAARPGDLEEWLASEARVPPPDAPPAQPAAVPVPPAPVVPVPPVAAAGALPARALPPLRLGPTRVTRTTLTTPVRVPGAGLLTQSVRTRIGRRTVTLCTTRATAGAAGPLSLRCRLGRTALRLRATSTLTVTVRTGFAPRAGAPQSIARRLVLHPDRVGRHGHH